MRGVLVYLLLGLLGALLQSSVFPLLLPTNLRPDLLLIIVLYLGLSEHTIRSIAITLLLGGIQDSFSGTSLGLYTTVYLAVLLLVRQISEHLNGESQALLMLLVLAGTLVQNLLLGFCLTVFADSGPVVGLLLQALPQKLLANLLAAGLMLLVLLKLQPLFGIRSGLAGLVYQSRRHGA